MRNTIILIDQIKQDLETGTTWVAARELRYDASRPIALHRRSSGAGDDPADPQRAVGPMAWRSWPDSSWLRRSPSSRCRDLRSVVSGRV